jgi:hypothetical protein
VSSSAKEHIRCSITVELQLVLKPFHFYRLVAENWWQKNKTAASWTIETKGLLLKQRRQNPSDERKLTAEKSLWSKAKNEIAYF